MVAFSSLVFDGCGGRASYGLWHGQEHGQANKQSIRGYSSLKICILTILIPPITLQLFFYAFRLPRCVVIMGIPFVTESQPQAENLRPHGEKHGHEHGQANKQSIRRYSSLKISILAI